MKCKKLIFVVGRRAKTLALRSATCFCTDQKPGSITHLACADDAVGAICGIAFVDFNPFDETGAHNCSGQERRECAAAQRHSR